MSPRDSRKPKEYFNRWIAYDLGQISEYDALLPTINQPRGIAICHHTLFSKHYKILIQMYSREDGEETLRGWFDKTIACWVAYQDYVATAPQNVGDQYIKFSIDKYVIYFWMFSFGVNMGVGPERLSTLAGLIQRAGQDRLIDRVIEKATGIPAREGSLLYERPYGKLLEFIETGAGDTKLLRKFLDGWYRNCKRAYWHDTHVDDDSGYFGYWCFELAAVVRLWEVDFTEFADHPYFPRGLMEFGR